MELIGGRVGLVIPSPPKASHKRSKECSLLIDEGRKKKKGREEGVNSTDPSIKNKKRQQQGGGKRKEEEAARQRRWVDGSRGYTRTT